MSDEGNFEVIDAGSALSSLAGSEVEAQVATAMRFPKHSTPEHLKRFTARVHSMVTATQEIAEDCFYRLERKGRSRDGQEEKKVIEGPSIRFAECLVVAWGNMRIDSGVSDIGDKYATTYGAAWDLETNVAERIVVKRRITARSGHRYSEDMAVTAANAARSIAKREAVLKTIPRVLWEPLFDAARKAAIGNSTDLPVRRQRLIEYFTKIGVTTEKILAKVGRTTVEEITAEDLMSLRGIANAIKENETTVEETFGADKPAESDQPSQTSEERTNAIVEQVRKAKEAAGEAPQPATEEKPQEADAKAEPSKTKNTKDSNPAADTKAPVT